MKRDLQKLWRSTSGAGAAEFALVLPLLLVLLFAIIDAGRFMWEFNKAEKATQVGARVAIVTDVLSAGLRDEDYAGKSSGGKTLGPGDRIPADFLGTVKCTNSGCTCEKTPCPSSLGTFNTATFNVLVARMQQIDPDIAAANVEVRYSGSGFGFAASAGGGGGGGGGAAEEMEVSPLVTVTLTGLKFRPITSLLFVEMDLPNFSTTLTAEDASGVYSY